MVRKGRIREGAESVSVLVSEGCDGEDLLCWRVTVCMCARIGAGLTSCALLEGGLTLCINSTISTMSTESLDRVAVFTLLLYELEILLRNFTLDSQVVGIQPIGSNKLAHGVLAP